ncbi:MAG: AAA-like domain-containing protein, partial [bacterium]
PDQQLAERLVKALEAGGHSVFWDTKLQVGQRWADEIGQHLRAAQFFVVLLSAASVTSEWVLKEIRLAHKLSHAKPSPLKILPVRVAYQGNLPGRLAANLDHIQYSRWETPADDQRVVSEIVAAVGHAQPLPETLTSSEAGRQRLFAVTEQVGVPLPQAEVLFETGTVRLDSPYYVPRSADAEVLGQVRAQGTTTIIKGPRQVGKSSLLARAAAEAVCAGKRALYVDFQLLDEADFADLKTLLAAMARLIQKKLAPAADLQELWDDRAGAKANLTDFVERAVLAAAAPPVVLLLDELDRIFRHAYRDDFFGMIRGWHNLRATQPAWDRLNVFLAHSTEPSLWIQDPDQSPLNVGLKVPLCDFAPAEVAELNRHYGSPLEAKQLPQLRNLIGGHPFLNRQAFHFISVPRRSLDELKERAAREDSPFASHLKRHAWALSQNPPLRKSFKQILGKSPCASEDHFERLLAVGLVAGESRTSCRPRCQLYADYFPKHL